MRERQGLPAKAYTSGPLGVVKKLGVGMRTKLLTKCGALNNSSLVPIIGVDLDKQ